MRPKMQEYEQIIKTSTRRYVIFAGVNFIMFMLSMVLHLSQLDKNSSVDIRIDQVKKEVEFIHKKLYIGSDIEVYPKWMRRKK